MPITATLSRKFYQKFGDEVTNELVAWLNAVDDSYRQEFRELFAAHFGQLRAEIDALRGEMGALRDLLRAEMSAMETRLRAHTDDRIAELRLDLLSLKAELKADQMAAERRLVRWVIGLWLATVPTMAGIFVALQKLGWL